MSMFASWLPRLCITIAPAVGQQLRRAKSLERKRAEPFLVLAGPAEPGETVLHDIRRQSPVHAARRYRTRRMRGHQLQRRSADTFANRLRLAERTAEIGIERLRHQRGALIEKQVTGRGVERGRGTGKHPPGRAVVKRREIDRIGETPVEETPAVRQELRSAGEPLAVTLERTGVGTPPAAGTWKKPSVSLRRKRMTPSRLHDPPRPLGTSQTI